MNAPLSREDWAAVRAKSEAACQADLPDRTRAEWDSAVVFAFLIAPGVGCVTLDLIAVAMDGIFWPGIIDFGTALFLPLIFAIGAYPIALVFGIPAYLLIRDFRVDIVGAALTGALVATAPFPLASLLAGWSIPDRSFDVAAIAAIGASGAVAGITFWALTFRRLSRRPRSAETGQQPSSPVSHAPEHQPVEPWRLSS